MNKVLYLFVTLTVAALYSCGSGERTDANVSTDNVQNEEAADSVGSSADKVVGNQSESATPTAGPRYTTTDAQLNYMNGSANSANYASGILPQMAHDAPEYLATILQKGTRFIIVDKGKMKVFLYDKYGNIEKSYPMACASRYGSRTGAWDSRTPEGLLDVQGVFNSSQWRFKSKSGHKSGPGVYGPKFIRLTPSIGIHGTSSPSSIGKRISHGCIRLSNQNILDLVQYVEEGMPVIVSPGPKDMLVNQREGRNILAVVTEPGGTKVKAGDIQIKPESDSKLVVSSTGAASPATKTSSSSASSNKDVTKETKKAETEVVPAETPNEPKEESEPVKTEPVKEEPAPAPAPSEPTPAT